MKTKRKLTAAAIATLPPDTYPDSILPGLNLVVGVKRKTWVLRHRVGGKQRHDRLGHYPAMGLADAREAARKIAERVEVGAPVAAPPPHPRAGKTLGDVIDAYEKFRRAKGERVKSLDHALHSVRTNLDAYLKLPAASFSKNDLRTVRDDIHKRAPYMASAFLRYLAPATKWASSEDLIPFNFTPDIAKIAIVQKRERILDANEIRAVWNASLQFEGGRGGARKSFGRLVRLALLCGQRKDEIASMRFGDILDGVWFQDANKTDKPHVVKLAAMALAEVGTGEARELVFPGMDGKSKLSGFSRLKLDLDAASGVTNWRLHDLRRTCATGMEELGFEPHVVEGVLNHALAGVSSIYQRGRLNRAKALASPAFKAQSEALAQWADHLSGILSAKRVAR